MTAGFPLPTEHTPKGKPKTNKCLQRERCATLIALTNCEYPAIIGTDGTVLNATTSIGTD